MSVKTNPFFKDIHGRFGFGCMRLPMQGEQVDSAEFTKMVDAFLEAGFNYFDTAHGYLGGKASECVRCGKCEGVCPQHLPIRELLKDVAREFEG